MATEIKIEKLKDGVTRSFIFEEGEAKTEGLAIINQVVKLNIAQEDEPTEKFAIDLGTEQVLNFEWKLYKEDNDRSEGTGIKRQGQSWVPTTIETYEEMLNYLEDVIFNPGSGIVDYRVTVTDKFRERTNIYIFEDFSIDVDSSIYPKGNAKFTYKKRDV